jgi:hypothetical protein
MAWSAFLAAVVLLTLLQADASGRVDLLSVFRELWARSFCMVPAIIALTIADIALSLVQGEARMMVYIFWKTSATPVVVKKLLYFFFTFGFAALRLWMTLTILTFALRESWRRGDVPSGPAATPV